MTTHEKNSLHVLGYLCVIGGLFLLAYLLGASSPARNFSQPDRPSVLFNSRLEPEDVDNRGETFWNRMRGQSVTQYLGTQISESVTANFGFGPGVLEGRTLFLHQWTMNDPLANDGDGLGPVCNANSCSACHFKGGVGGAGDLEVVMKELELNTPALFGVGIIDRISTQAIRENINDHYLVHHGDRIGRFGWQGEFKSLRDFVGTAAAVEVGLTNELRHQDLPGRRRPNKHAGHDLSTKQLDQLVAYCRSLPRPEQVLPDDPKERIDILYGETVFKRIGCASCHTPDLDGVSGLYTNFGVYVLDDNADHYSNHYKDDEERGWKTPALWGVADSAPYWHDGSAKTLSAAILKHGHDADRERYNFMKASKPDKACLIKFLKSLKAPSRAEPCPKELRGTVEIAPGGLMCY